MNLRVLLPTQILIDAAVLRVAAEAENGGFCLLPRHRDFVTALPPGILAYAEGDGVERYLGLGEAVLVKYGERVQVSAVYGIQGEHLGEIREALTRAFETEIDREHQARSAMAKLETELMRRFVEVGGAHD